MPIIQSAVTDYVQTELAPRLRTYGVRSNGVLADVQQRLIALLRHWSKPHARAAWLVTGYEEATYYDPASAPLDVRALVVVGVRNSQLENWHAVQKNGQPGPIDDEALKWLTTTAVRWWARELATPQTWLDHTSAADTWQPLPTMYPAAWQALAALSSLTPTRLEADFLPVMPCPDLILYRTARPAESTTRHTAVLSGASPEIDQGLATVLYQLHSGQVFYVDSFKMLTRNLVKLMRVLEFLLMRGGSLTTTNCHLTSGYVTRRRDLLRPSHTSAEMQARARTPAVVDVGERHAAALINVGHTS